MSIDDHMERLTVAAQNTITHWSDTQVRGYLKEHPGYVLHDLELIEDMARTVRTKAEAEKTQWGQLNGDAHQELEDQVDDYRDHSCNCDHCYQREVEPVPESIYETFGAPTPDHSNAVNTCRFTINFHAATDQCGDHMVNHTVHIDPINVALPQWVTRAATKNMCADRNGEHDHWLPDMDHVTRAMIKQGIDVVVILGDERRSIERELCDDDDHSYIADVISAGFDDVEGRTAEDTAVVFDLVNDLVIVTTPKLAWDAK